MQPNAFYTQCLFALFVALFFPVGCLNRERHSFACFYLTRMYLTNLSPSLFRARWSFSGAASQLCARWNQSILQVYHLVHPMKSESQGCIHCLSSFYAESAQDPFGQHALVTLLLPRSLIRSSRPTTKSFNVRTRCWERICTRVDNTIWLLIDNCVIPINHSFGYCT